MYLHLGQETVVKMDSIVGIFDLDTSTISKFTRDYLTQAEKSGKVVNVSMELPTTETNLISIPKEAPAPER